MKKIDLRIVTISSILIVVLLQTTWLYSAYSFIEKDIKNKMTMLLKDAINEETLWRLTHTPEGTQIEGRPINMQDDALPDNVYMQESLLKLGFPLSLAKLDSIYTSLLHSSLLPNKKIIIRVINPLDNKILSETDSEYKMGIGSMQTETIPIRVNKSEAIQALYINPYRTIFQRIRALLVATIIMMFLIGYCIIYQIRIIIHQDKLAKLKEDFSYAMIHDMKTPLSTIILGIHGLQNKKIDSLPELKEMYLKHAQEECDHLLKLTEKILTLSKLESKSVKMNKELIALQPLIESLTEKYALVKEKTIHFNIDLSTPYIYADREHLKEVVNNLIDNSIKYSKDSVQIDITSTEKNGDVLLKVKDNGLGIAIKDQAKIFERFERAAAVKRNRKGGASGFGLGLNYVQQVVKAHGGRVELDSIEGMYSEFILYFPHSLQEEETA